MCSNYTAEMPLSPDISQFSRLKNFNHDQNEKWQLLAGQKQWLNFASHLKGKSKAADAYRTIHNADAKPTRDWIVDLGGVRKDTVDEVLRTFRPVEKMGRAFLDCRCNFDQPLPNESKAGSTVHTCPGSSVLKVPRGTCAASPAHQKTQPRNTAKPARGDAPKACWTKFSIKDRIELDAAVERLNHDYPNRLMDLGFSIEPTCGLALFIFTRFADTLLKQCRQKNNLTPKPQLY